MGHGESIRTGSWSRLVLILAVSVCTGCTGATRIDRAIHESPGGSVVLELVGTPAFQAAHPLSLDEATVSKALTGLRVQETEGTTSLMFPSTPPSARALTDAEVAFLTPHLTAALAQATPKQRVAFRFNSSPERLTLSQTVGAAVGSSEPQLIGQIVETTRGYLYAHGLSLHLTFTEYRHRPERADTINMANRRLPDLTGLGHRTFTFVPGTALRPESYKQSWAFDDPDAKSLVLDYQLVASLPATAFNPPPSPAPGTPQAPTALPASPAPSAAQPKSDSPGTSDADLQSLKDDLKALQKKVDEQNAELQKLKKPSGKKPALGQGQ